MALDLPAITKAVQTLRATIERPPRKIDEETGAELVPEYVIHQAGETLRQLLTPSNPYYAGDQIPVELDDKGIPLKLRVKLKELWRGLTGVFWSMHAASSHPRDEWVLALTELHREIRKAATKQAKVPSVDRFHAVQEFCFEWYIQDKTREEIRCEASRYFGPSALKCSSMVSQNAERHAKKLRRGNRTPEIEAKLALFDERRKREKTRQKRIK